jgi:ribosomal-protein-alanine N-acetyltransferase
VSPGAHLPVLATERLIIRVPTVRDADAVSRFVTDNRDHFAPWDPLRSDDYFTSAYWKHALELGVDRFRQGTHLQFIISEHSGNSAIAGQITLSGITRGVFHAAYLGYGLDRGFVGRGYMQEALAAVIEYSFEEMNLHRIMANYMPANERSQRLLEKLGFEREGFARDYLLLAGKWQDHVLMSITNPGWNPE